MRVLHSHVCFSLILESHASRCRVRKAFNAKFRIWAGGSANTDTYDMLTTSLLETCPLAPSLKTYLIFSSLSSCCHVILLCLLCYLSFLHFDVNEIDHMLLRGQGQEHSPRVLLTVGADFRYTSLTRI
jgi:hypothetical protein